jgi:predicted ribosomally synthesized peptide with nif11-like leader
MALAHIEQFSSRVKNDPEMFKQLVAGTQTPDEFIDKAVALAAQKGFNFSREEADAWIKTQIAAKASGELSDMQLEGVAGGKGASDQKIADAFTTIGNELAYQAADLGKQIGNWFASW